MQRLTRPRVKFISLYSFNQHSTSHNHLLTETNLTHRCMASGVKPSDWYVLEIREWVGRQVYVYVCYPRQPRCLSCYNIPEDRGCNCGSFFLPVSTRDRTYIIIMHCVDASVLTTQVASQALRYPGDSFYILKLFLSLWCLGLCRLLLLCRVLQLAKQLR